MKRWAWRLAAALFGLWVVTALYSLRPVSHDSEPVTYLLSWDIGEAKPLGDGSWSVSTDLGYEVVVLDGWIVTHEATAIGCLDESSWFDSIIGALLPSVASAGHGASAEETVVSEMVELLTDPQSLVLGSGEADHGSYCQSHLAFGAADPDGLTLHMSLLVDGIPHLVETGDSWGTLGELVGAADRDNEALVIEIVRDLGAMFEGVDFDATPDDELGVAVLRALSAGIVFELT